MFICVFKLDGGLQNQHKQWERSIVKKMRPWGKDWEGMSLGYKLHIQKSGLVITKQKSAPTKCMVVFDDVIGDSFFDPKNILSNTDAFCRVRFLWMVLHTVVYFRCPGLQNVDPQPGPC